MDQRHADARADLDRRAVLHRHRPVRGHLGMAQALGREAHHLARARPDADDPDLRLPDPDAAFVRQQPGFGDDRDRHLRHAADGAGDDARPVQGAVRDRRFQRDGRLHGAPETLEGAVAVGAADADGRRQPGHHAGAEHGDHRLDDRRRRPRLRRAPGAARAEGRRGDGSRPGHRRAGHRARPAEPGYRAQAGKGQCPSGGQPKLLAALSQSDACHRHPRHHDAAWPVRASVRGAAESDDPHHRAALEGSGKLDHAQFLRHDRSLPGGAHPQCAEPGARLLRRLSVARSGIPARPCRLPAFRLAPCCSRRRADRLLRRHRSLGKDHGDGLSLRHLGLHRLPDRHSGRADGGAQRPFREDRDAHHRHAAGTAVLLLHHPGGDAVQGRRRHSDDRHRRLRRGAGHPLHQSRHQAGAAGTDRGGQGVGLHQAPDLLSRATAAGAAGDHARRQPDDPDGTGDDHHLRHGRHPRSRPGSVHRAVQGRFRPRHRCRAGHRLHRHCRRPAVQCVDGEGAGEIGVALQICRLDFTAIQTLMFSADSSRVTYLYSLGGTIKMSKLSVFVACPYKIFPLDDYKATFSSVSKTYPVTFKFADEQITSDHILHKITEYIRSSDISLFDITGWNPNVALELGIAIGLSKRYFILLNPRLDQNQEVPSDIKGIDRIQYISNSDLEAKLMILIRQEAPPLTSRSDSASDTLKIRINDALKNVPGLNLAKLALATSEDKTLVQSTVRAMVSSNELKTKGNNRGTTYYTLETDLRKFRKKR
ncbi:hypothetical protein MESS4_380003 [Mesorhizobium sp. STM 4661]|nr:hypothetical protein MESS4_380003 [Mesorhizobium sp. STM 4661]